MTTKTRPHTLLTHIALPVSNLDATLAFYAKYTTMEKIHERFDPETHMRSAWIANTEDKTDTSARFVIVVTQADHR
jgi:lactoylglutathione lyase